MVVPGEEAAAGYEGPGEETDGRYANSWGVLGRREWRVRLPPEVVVEVVLIVVISGGWRSERMLTLP